METQIESMSGKVLERAQLKQLVSAYLSAPGQRPMLMVDDLGCSGNAKSLIEFVTGQIGSKVYYAPYGEFPSDVTVANLPHDVLVLQGWAGDETLAALLQLCGKCTQHVIYMAGGMLRERFASIAGDWSSSIVSAYYCWNRSSMLSMAQDFGFDDVVKEYICHDDFALRP